MHLTTLRNGSETHSGKLKMQNTRRKKFSLNSIIDSNGNHNILLHEARTKLGVERPLHV